MNDAIKFCGNCGKQNPVGNNYCNNCGTRFEESFSESQPGLDTQTNLNNHASEDSFKSNSSLLENMDDLDEKIKNLNAHIKKVRIIGIILIACSIVIFILLNESQNININPAIFEFTLWVTIFILAIVMSWMRASRWAVKRKKKSRSKVQNKTSAVYSSQSTTPAKTTKSKPPAWKTILVLAFSALAIFFSFKLLSSVINDVFGLGIGNSSVSSSSNNDESDSFLNLFGGSSGGSGSDACADVPVDVIYCYCSNQNSQGVWCEVDSGESDCYTDSHGIRMCTSGTGEGRIPYECTKQLGLCP